MEQLPPPPERSKRLHNFTLPYLRWGQQRFLRCVKLPHHRSPSSSSPSPDRASFRSHHNNGGALLRELVPGGDGKQQLTLDLVPKLSSVLGNDGGEKNNGDAAVVAARPWNLRTRRAACNEPGGGGVDESTTRIIIESSSSIGIKRGIEGDCDGDSQNKNDQKVKFSVPLLREEIEEDFSALLGKRPPRRPKKRPRLVQKQMNTLFPGLWLAEEVTVDSYDVAEVVET